MCDVYCIELDRGSIRKDKPLVIPALNLSILDAGILLMVQPVSLMMFSLNMVDYPVYSSYCPPGISWAGQVKGTILRCSYSLTFFVGPLLHA